MCTHTHIYSQRLPWWLRQERICLKCRRLRFNPWVRESPAEGDGNPLQYSCLGHPMDRGIWLATVHGVAKVRYN